MKLKIFISLVALVASLASVSAQVPASIGYQGRLTAAGTNFNGAGFFKFALIQQTTNMSRSATAQATVTGGGVASILVVDGGVGYETAPRVTVLGFPGSPAAGATATAVVAGGTVVAINVVTPGANYGLGAFVMIDPPPANYAVVGWWSDSGGTLDGVEPTFSVPLTVANGLFNVNLGDPSLMTYLPPELFTNSALWLRVWFSNDNTNFQRLSPDQPLVSAPYAMMAGTAESATNAAYATTAATASLALSMPWGGLTGVPSGAGLMLGTSNTFNVAFGGTGSSNTVARSDHNHFGQTWSGSAPVGLAVSNGNTGAFSSGLFGSQGGATPFVSAASGVRGASVGGFGLFGESVSGTAVVGFTTGATGTTYGVQGIISATNGAGILGLASAGSGTAVGVDGVNSATGGIGVRGNASSATGTSYGVAGLVSSPNGAGVYGVHSASSGSAPGVQGETASTDVAAAGVLGRTTSAGQALTSAGLRGQNESATATGMGVMGYSGPSNPGAIGRPNSGVYGVSMITGGNGIVGEANNGATSFGVWGISSAGYGGSFSGGSYGLEADSASGIGGYFSGGSYGLYSSANSGMGGYFLGTSYGVYGTASAGTGGCFSGTPIGVSATGTSVGVNGTSTSIGVEGNGYSGVYGIASANGNGVWGQADSGTSAYGVYGTSANGYGGYFSGGNFGLYVLGSSYLSYNSSLSKPSLEIHENGSGNYARLRLSTYSYPFWDIAVGSTANVMNFYNNTNGNVMSLSAGGDLSVATITIRGGADVAEPFQMSHSDIPKGAVVVIDAEHPGQLKLSDRAYDTRVAGVLSGANGIQPGLSLHQEGALDGGQNVALTGRVYVQADAVNGAIEPGDLLTTSAVPGYAMKVTDHARAQGAILGKAMSSLNQGQGLVLVLVTLQ